MRRSGVVVGALVLSLACAAETADHDDGGSLEEQSAAFRAVLEA